MTSNSIADRLRELAGSGSTNAFAKKCGLPATSIRQYLEGSIPGADKVAQIAERNGVSLLWLVTGQGPMRRLEGSEKPTEGFDDFRMVPRLNVAASAGQGAVVEREDEDGLIAFRADWLRRRGVSPAAARALTVRGDSMEPTIRSGDILLVDTSIRSIEDNGIYVVVSAGLVQVKRVHPRPGGVIVLISDNTVYPREEVALSEASDFSIAGRVMWFGRSI